MKKQLIRISILQSAKIMTALYVVIGDHLRERSESDSWASFMPSDRSLWAFSVLSSLSFSQRFTISWPSGWVAFEFEIKPMD